jgi:tRNA A-37 threonylcarbamoyl transferase component Bud32
MDWELFYNSFRKPDFIPGFEIQNRLGGGAFGDVYRARKRSIDKHYAIKFLKIDDQAQRSAIERELEQVRHFAAIDHPNLVTIEDMGVVLDVPYLVMGYAGEDTLARRLRRERIDADKGLLFFVQICRGVNALHERRLAHFDLKPSNVFLKGDVARVGDYGLAKLMIDGRQTLSFGRGTPQYMAPEMLRNRADMRADVYSLGVILFEIVTGKLPFDPTEDAGIVIREEDVPPVFPADFPAPLRIVVTRSLRIAPDARYQSVAELLAALGQTAHAGDPLVPLSAARGSTTVVPVATTGKGELRNTATELTRGAVEVARGVWEGLRSARPESPRTRTDAERAATPRAPPAVAPAPLAQAPIAQAPIAQTSTMPAQAAPTPRATPTPAQAPAIPPLPEAARTASPPPIPAQGRAPERERVLSIQTLEEVAREAREKTPMRDVPRSDVAVPGVTAPPPRAADVALSEAWFDEDSRRPAGGFPVSAPAVLGAGTVPVPPRARGGPLHALGAALQLAFEVFVTLLSGPVRRTVGHFGRAGDRFVRGGRSAVANLARLCVFLTGMLLLGAILMYFLLLLFNPR